MKKLTIILFLVALFTSQALGHKQEEEWANFVVIAIITIMNNVDDMLLAQQLKTVQEVELSHGLICGIPNGVESGGKKRVNARRWLINMSSTQKMIKKTSPTGPDDTTRRFFREESDSEFKNAPTHQTY